MIRVILPPNLRTLAQLEGEVELELNGTLTQRSLLDAVEAKYPMLRGTMRDHVTQVRRPMVRFFACGEDLSHESPDAPLPECDCEWDRTIPDHRCNCGWIDNRADFAGQVLFDAPRGSQRLIARLTPNRYAPAHVWKSGSNSATEKHAAIWKCDPR